MSPKASVAQNRFYYIKKMGWDGIVVAVKNNGRETEVVIKFLMKYYIDLKSFVAQLLGRIYCFLH